MFNIGFAELLAIIVVCLVVFGPERLPEVARQLGRFIGQARLTTQRMLDELRSESELKDLNLPDLKVGNLRSQARNYVTGLLDVEGQMAELEREAKELESETKGNAKPSRTTRPSATNSSTTATSKQPQATATAESSAPSADTDPGADSASASASTSGDSRPPIDPDAT